MKKPLAILFLMLAVNAKAQTIFWWDYPMNVGSLTTNINQSFSNMLPFVQSAVSNRAVSTDPGVASNWVWWVSNSTDGSISYWNVSVTNGAAAGGAGTTAWLSNGTPVHASASTVDVTGVAYTIASNSNGKITLNLVAQAGGITNEMVYDILPTWGTPYHPVTASNAIDASTKVANDTLSTRTATTRTAVIMFSLVNVSNTLQGVGRPFSFLSPGPGMTNYAVTWSADQTTTGSLVLLYYNPSGIGPVAAGITGTVSAANTPTVLNMPLASTFLTNIARGVKILGDAFFYSASTNAANQRLQGILDWKAQR